ncbi:MAG: hypothetical protein ACREQ7_00745 [Candidatus Binatia bacterium]
MWKLALAIAVVFGVNMISSIIDLATPVSYAQEEPQPEPKPEPKPKPDSE